MLVLAMRIVFDLRVYHDPKLGHVDGSRSLGEKQWKYVFGHCICPFN